MPVLRRRRRAPLRTVRRPGWRKLQFLLLHQLGRLGPLEFAPRRDRPRRSVVHGRLRRHGTTVRRAGRRVRLRRVPLRGDGVSIPRRRGRRRQRGPAAGRPPLRGGSGARRGGGSVLLRGGRRVVVVRGGRREDLQPLSGLRGGGGGGQQRDLSRRERGGAVRRGPRGSEVRGARSREGGVPPRDDVPRERRLLRRPRRHFCTPVPRRRR
mmetsp:Transcript_23165/g.68389  ORF Transcript_23165/g.68389 Transcript_23165/m.68389 type:complete len:210 (-) Transcript_23165:549-1178(-)